MLIQLGFLSSSSEFWVSAAGFTESSRGYSVAVDSVGNIYAAGVNTSAGANSVIIKYNSLGEILWSRTLSGSANIYNNDITIDSSDNVLVTGYFLPTGGPNDNIIVAKYDSSGTLQWQKTLDSTFTDYGNGIKTDSSNNVYVCGFGSTEARLFKYNSSGVLQWQKQLKGSLLLQDFVGIDIDSSNNVYVAGKESTGLSAGEDALLVKYDSSGNLVWQRTLSNSEQNAFYAVAVDSAGSVYAAGATSIGPTASGSRAFLIAKYDSSGTLQWQRSLNGSFDDFAFGLAVDSSDNVYVSGSSSTSTTAGGLIAKYDSSGTLQWQRTLTSTSLQTLRKIATGPDNVIYACGEGSFDNGVGLLLIRLPNNGSVVGTAVLSGRTLSVSQSSLTDVATSLVSATSSLTNSDGSLTDGTSTFTSNIASITRVIEEI